MHKAEEALQARKRAAAEAIKKKEQHTAAKSAWTAAAAKVNEERGSSSYSEQLQARFGVKVMLQGGRTDGVMVKRQLGSIRITAMNTIASSSYFYRINNIIIITTTTDRPTR